MQNFITINNYSAVITFDPETKMFQGKFINLNGGADFYASSVQELFYEGKVSLKSYLEVCKEQDINI